MLATLGRRIRTRKRIAQTVRFPIAQGLLFELLVAIFRSLAPGILYNVPTLCSACLVCRSWSAAAQYVLYSTIYLFSSTGVARFCRTLTRQPALCPLVRDFHIGGLVSKTIYRRRLLQLRKPVCSPLLTCTSLRTLVLWAANSAPPTSIEDISVYFPIDVLPQLRVLSLKFNVWGDSESHGFTRRFRRATPSFSIRATLPQLEQLYLSNFDLGQIITRLPPSLPRLRQLLIETNRMTPESLQALLSGCGPHLSMLTLCGDMILWGGASIFHATTSPSVQTLRILGFYSTAREVPIRPVLPAWPALREVHFPVWTAVQRAHALPCTVVRVSVWPRTDTLHDGRVWELAGWIYRALRLWRASAPGLASLRIMDSRCRYAELATWRLASFLLSGRCVEMGIKLTVDVQVDDMHSVLNRLSAV